jgi:hypothetical protein
MGVKLTAVFMLDRLNLLNVHPMKSSAGRGASITVPGVPGNQTCELSLHTADR